ncbi:ABC transporter permease [Vallitalea pronyensis]|uniref:ABC transporter permease n=1 Tax=Vallitalea pronyensis TaxID=1348613 RepID=A0A8J8SJ07_9FIRM|nr:ABC transporter permease [Vallitalea pronyensis]QUI25166.1 ABC transporter permease [Vallitalea pronyensis]
MKRIYVHRLIWFVMVIVIWEVTYSTNRFAKQIFPSIWQILQSMVDDFAKGDLLMQIGFSLLIILKGLFIAMIAAILLSFLDYFYKYFSNLLDTLIGILHPLPGIALLPLVIIWFGIGENAILLIIIHAAVWPMTINIKTGFKSVDKTYIEIGKNLGMNIWQIFYYVLMPLSFLHVLASLKIGWSRAWRGLISAEMVFGAIGPFGGLGWFIFQKRVFMDTAGMYGGLVIIILIGVLMEDFVFGKAERWFDAALHG